MSHYSKSDLRYADVCRWTKVHNLIVNRISIINQIHGCRYDGLVTNPCKLKRRDGHYVVDYCGEEMARWLLYDVDTVESAFRVVDRLSRALWLGRRAGVLRLSPDYVPTV